MKQAIVSAALLCAAVCPARLSAADEIVFKKQFGGGKVKCEIYKEDDDYIHYVDVERKMDCGCSREIVEKIVKEPGELLDVEEFFVQKAKEAKDAKAREKAELIAEELRKKREAEEKQKENEFGEKKVGNLRIRPATEKAGMTKLRSTDTGSNELLVDPFPEEGDGPTPADKRRKVRGRRR
ncbi:MAG: hypothetical protein ACYTGB_05185 [Planctomycetota bacterium]|jgi:hypothetical protein